MSITAALDELFFGDPDDPFSYVPARCTAELMEAFDRLPSEAEEAFISGDVKTALAFLRGAGYQWLAFEVSQHMPHWYDV